MAFFSNLVHHPRKLWLRRALFQVHLWLGVLLSVYVAVIGFSGSVLVWEDELKAHALRHVAVAEGAPLATPGTVVAAVKAAYPDRSVTYFMWPQEKQPVYTIYLRDAKHERSIVYANAATGALLPPQGRSFIDWDNELHVYLLMGQTGFIINCVAGIGLLVLAITGLVLWWPGLRAWMRGFYINLRAGWKRVNYDAHNAIGIWTLLIVSWWGFTAIDFLFPKQVMSAVSVISPVKGMKQPDAPKALHVGEPMSIEDFAEKAHVLAPTAFLSGLLMPEKPTGNVVAYMDRDTPGDFSHRVILTFARDGQLLQTWHYGEKQTLGDWVIWLVYPLHFGTLWGTWVKVVWTVLGMSLPVLSISGLLMYWNRFLGKRWKALRAS